MKTKLVLSMLTLAVVFTACKKESPEPITGCTDPTAINFNPLASIDDSSCVYDIYGCTDSTAINFNPLASIDDSSCIYETIVAGTITELDAQAATFAPNPPPEPPTITGDYTKFSFAEGTVVEGDDWDVAFRSTSIIFNGGMASDTSQPNRTGNAAVYLIDGTMEDISLVDESLLLQDEATSTAIIDDMGIQQMGWCIYDFATNMISPIAGKILVVRTHDNKYAKIEILNFYDATCTNVYGGFYTFNYVYQSEESNLTF